MWIQAYIKSAWASFFSYFSKRQCFKKSHLNTTEGSLILSDVGHWKIKPNRWRKRFHKMRDLHRCRSPKKLANMKKQHKHIYWGPTDPLSVARGLKKSTWVVFHCKMSFRNFPIAFHWFKMLRDFCHTSILAELLMYVDK